jgi:hypothetical protein
VRERAGSGIAGGVGGDRRELAEGARGIGAALDAKPVSFAAVSST